jgi:Ca2+-binding EF-hand superfamily protein
VTLFRLIPVIGLLAGMATAAAAAPTPLDTLRMPADTNNDGKISLEEYQTSRRDYIMRADANKDGKVTRQEWDRAAQSLRNRLNAEGFDGADLIGKGGWFDQIDANKDGVITPAEIDVMTKARFETFDLNHDGFLDRKEVRQAMKAAGIRP